MFGKKKNPEYEQMVAGYKVTFQAERDKANATKLREKAKAEARSATTPTGEKLRAAVGAAAAKARPKLKGLATKILQAGKNFNARTAKFEAQTPTRSGGILGGTLGAELTKLNRPTPNLAPRPPQKPKKKVTVYYG
jgi:hypothetical protein